MCCGGSGGSKGGGAKRGGAGGNADEVKKPHPGAIFAHGQWVLPKFDKGTGKWTQQILE